MMEDKLKIVLVEPNKKARIVEMGRDLEDMQKAVGGYIEMFPLADEVCIVCNEEGKLDGLEPNRGIFHDGKLVEIICGPFFICAAPMDSDRFESLTDEQAAHYVEEYRYPEVFVRTVRGIAVIKRK